VCVCVFFFWLLLLVSICLTMWSRLVLALECGQDCLSEILVSIPRFFKVLFAIRHLFPRYLQCVCRWCCCRRSCFAVTFLCVARLELSIRISALHRANKTSWVSRIPAIWTHEVVRHENITITNSSIFPSFPIAYSSFKCKTGTFLGAKLFTLRWLVCRNGTIRVK